MRKHAKRRPQKSCTTGAQASGQRRLNRHLDPGEEPQKKHAMGIVCAVPKTFNGLKDDEKVILENLKVGQLVWFSEWAAQSLKGCEKQSIVSVKDIYAIITQEGEE